MRSDIQKKKSRGFGLVELLLVMVILGILAGMTMLAYGRSSDNTEATAIMAHLESAKSALLSYSMEYRTRNKDPLEGFDSASSAGIIASIDKYLEHRIQAGGSAAVYFNKIKVSGDVIQEVGFDGFTVKSGVGKALDKKISTAGGVYRKGGSATNYSLWLRIK